MHASSLEGHPPVLTTLVSSSKLHSMVGKAKVCSNISVSRQRLDMPYGLFLVLLMSPSGEYRLLFRCIAARCSSTLRVSSSATVAGRLFRLNAAVVKAVVSFMFIIVVILEYVLSGIFCSFVFVRGTYVVFVTRNTCTFGGEASKTPKNGC
jgi:hypothetical protein